MHKIIYKNINALFNFLLNKAFLFSLKTILTCFFCGISIHLLIAQNNNYLDNNIAFSASTQSISRLNNSNSLLNYKYNFRFSKFVIAYQHPLYKKITIKNNELKFVQINLMPSLQIGNANFGADNLNRTIINTKLGLLSIFNTSAKNTFTISVNTFANEDEYTLPNASYRYSGLLMFNRKINNKFSYRIGLTFTYLFGEPLLLPILGLKYKTSNKSILNVVLPLIINWKKQTKINNLFYGFSLKPNGGINKYQNKLSVDSSNTTLILRRKSIQFTADVRMVNKTNMVLFQAGINTNQRILFTNENTNSIVNNFEFMGSNSLFANISFIWFLKRNLPNETMLRNNINNQTITENEVIDNSWFDY